jgi:repressor LexA
VRLLGRIAAGVPLLAGQLDEGTYRLPRQLVGGGTLFMLTVAGDSMTGASIFDGDLVVVRQQPAAETGEIVAAMVTGGSEPEATVKTLHRAGGHIWAQAAKPGLPADTRRRRHHHHHHHHGQGGRRAPPNLTGTADP